jgi:Mrp family chromosome partitioning ATPase
MKIKNVAVVMSGKGGVGKSTVTVQIAVYLASIGKKVGVVDADLCGPSLPRLFNVQNGAVAQGTTGWIPMEVSISKDVTIKLISMEFLMNEKDGAVIWRGPKKTAMIERFIKSVEWGELDVLLVDTPPGTSDEHLAVFQTIQASLRDTVLNYGAVIVTTPQLISLQDVQRQISFCHELNVPILGVVENMSGYICSKCSHCNNVFSSGGGEQLAEMYNVEFLGKIPLNRKVGNSSNDILSVGAFEQICKNVLSHFVFTE